MSPDKRLRDVIPTTKVGVKPFITRAKRSYLADIPAIFYHFRRHLVMDARDC